MDVPVNRLARALLLGAGSGCALFAHADDQPLSPTPEPYEAVIPVPTPTPALVSSEAQVEADAVMLAPVIVTGAKRGRTVAETPASVAVVGARELERATEPALHELVSQFANVLSAQSDRQIAIRGVLQTGIAGEGDTVSVYLDGLALPPKAANFGGPLSTFDLAQVEVLRGPQSTTQGRNSLAGAVILRTRDPEPEWDARLRMAISDPGSYQRAFAGGGPVLGDALSFRVAVEDRYEQGDVYNRTRDEADAAREDRRSGRIKLRFHPEDGGYDVILSLSRSLNEFGDNIHDATGGERTASANVRYSERYQANVFALEQTLPLGDFALTSVTGYIEGRDSRDADYDRTEAERGVSTFQVDDDSLSQELRLSYESARVSALFGAYSARDHRYELTTGRDIPVGGGAAFLSGFVESRADIDNHALFGEVDWDLLQALRLTAGLRWDVEHARRRAVSDIDFAARVPGERVGADETQALPSAPLPDPLVDRIQPLAADQVPPDYAEQGDHRFEVLLPKVGLTWWVSPGHSVSLTYQEGYRSGGTSVSFFGGQRSDYDPEHTRNLELALRSRGWDERLSLNLNVFATRWSDQQVNLGVERSYETVTVNAGRSRLYGAEAESVWRIHGPFEAFLSLGYLDTKFEEFTNGDADYAGNRFPYAARYSGSLGFTLTRWRALEAQVSAQRIGSYYGAASNEPDTRLPAKTLLHARAGVWLRPGLQLFVYGRNLTDALNLQDRYVVENGAGSADDRQARRYGEPRTLGAGFEWML